MIKVIISLTSYPKRIHTVHKVINSLFLQNEKADEIILWLSEVDFPKRNEELPLELLELDGKNGFHIRWVKENLKSHKKYFYVLQEYSDSIVITVDDDMYYAKTMTSILLASYKRHPHAISARNVHRIFKKEEKIAPYITWAGRVDHEDEERMDLCAIGVNGILYPPGCANEKWFDIETIQKCAENQDDLWLKYNEVRDGIPVVFAGLGENDILIEETQGSVLYIKNAHEGGNDDCIKKLKKYDAMGKKIWKSWLDELIPIEDYLEKTEQDFRVMFENIFDTYINQNIYICGAGKYARVILQLLERIGGIEYIKALLVSEKNNTGSFGTKRVQHIGEMQRQFPFTVICGVSELYRDELKKVFDSYEMCNWIEVDMLDIIEYVRLLELNSNLAKERKNEQNTKGN